MDLDSCKKVAALKALEYVHDKMIVGLGTGSTAFHFINALGKKCADGLDIWAIASSDVSKKQALANGIPLIDESEAALIDITVDGADEIDPTRQMIKGGGGALLREKILATACKKLIIIADETKLVGKFGRHPLPIEIIPFGFNITISKLKKMGYSGNIRLTKDQIPYVTENRNYIFDAALDLENLNPSLEQIKLRQIPGVVETGFFLGLNYTLIVGFRDGRVEISELN